MTCPSCNFVSPPGMGFCGRCGTALARTCDSCQFANPPGFRFCGQCGAALEGEPTESSMPGTSPRAYTPGHLARRILTNRSNLEGERKQVTVLFADVKRSMELAGQLGPEEWHRILDRFFTILTEGVHRFEGTVNQYTGDGIMALFGAPIAHEDHAQRACYAALHLSERLREYADELRIRHGLNFSVRMGINSGKVVVGKIGDDLRMDYTAQGQSVGLAARMERLAEPGRTYVTEATAKLVSGYFKLRDLGTAAIRGVSEPVRVFDLEGPGGMQTRFDVARARGLSRFVGREADMGQLDAALAEAMAGRGQVVGLVAEPGIGKTRLCYEFADRCRAQGIPVRAGHGVAHGAMVPFLPVLEFFRDYFEITSQDGARTARNKIAGTLLLLDRSFEAALPLMFDFLGVPDPDTPATPMPPDARQRRLFDVAREIIRAGSARTPGVILMEDLHWIDAGTEAFLQSAVDAVKDTRTLLLVNFRPEYDAAWLHGTHYREIALSPLDEQAIDGLLQDLLGDDPSLAGLARRIQKHAGGNPFFIEEIVLSLAETGRLPGVPGAYRLTEPLLNLGVPKTVQALLAARIDRLPDLDKTLLQIAAVIGRAFTEGILQQVAAQVDGRCTDGQLANALGALVAAGFLFQREVFPEATYGFKHPLTREVAYGAPLSDRRAAIHAATARTVAEVHVEQLEERAALLAHHWERAREPLEAARWHRRAARWAGLGHAAEGFAHWHKVLDLVASLPSSPETDELGAVARAEIIFFGARVGAPAAEMKGLFDDGCQLARRRGNDAELASLAGSYGSFVYFTTGVLDDALGHLLEGLELADRTHDTRLRIAARYMVTNCASFGGRIAQGLVTSAEGLELCRNDPGVGADLVGYSAQAGLQTLRAMLLAAAGRLAEARRLTDAVISAAADERDDYVQAIVHYALGHQLRLAGDAARAIAACRKSVTLAESLGGQPFRILSYHALGAALALGAQWEESIEAIEHALALMEELRTYRFAEGSCRATLARATLGTGNQDRALALARAAVPVAHRNGWLAECDAQLVLARVLTQVEGRSAAEPAEAALERAAGLVALSEARSRLPIVHERRAGLAEVLGQPEAQDRELSEAHRLFAQMGAPGHAQRIAARRSRAGVKQPG